MAKNEKLDWTMIDPTTLPADCRKAYEAYKANYAVMKKAKDEFEAMVTAQLDLPKGKTVVFGYMFGKLSVALTDIVDKPKAKTSAIALSDLIKR